MKIILCTTLVLGLALLSCSSNDPDYDSYKKQQEAAGAPYGPNADPYGAAAANPYGVPGGSSEVGSYQPLPPVNPEPNTPLGTPRPAPSYPTIPSPAGAPAAAGAPATTTPHVVQTGDTLWGLARKYGTTVEAIRQANGLTGNTIMTDTTLQIPSP